MDVRKENFKENLVNLLRKSSNTFHTLTFPKPINAVVVSRPVSNWKNENGKSLQCLGPKEACALWIDNKHKCFDVLYKRKGQIPTMSVLVAFSKMLDRSCMVASFKCSIIRVSTSSCEQGTIFTVCTVERCPTMKPVFLRVEWALHESCGKPKQFCFDFQDPMTFFQFLGIGVFGTKWYRPPSTLLTLVIFLMLFTK